ncbi:MAG: CSLREA domain-containing protein [bacterium]
MKSFLSKITHIFFPVFLLLAFAGNVHANTLKVTRTDDPPPNGCQPNDCSLREAITAANQDSQTDTIEIPAGWYTIGAGANDEQNLKGDFDIWVSMDFKGAGKGKTIIDGERLDRLFHLHHQNATFKVSFSDLTIAGGNAANGNGGAIYAEAGYEVAVKNCRILHNTADLYGGAIYTTDGSLVLENTDLKGNMATKDGGGIYYADNLGSGQFKVTGGEFSQNGSGRAGGAIAVIKGSLGADSVNFKQNHAGLYGGAVATLSGSSLTLKNSKITDNSAFYRGGGLHLEGAATLLNDEITENEADIFGGGFDMVSSGAPINIQGSVLAGNTSETGDGPDCEAIAANPLTSVGSNKFGDLKGCEHTSTESDVTGFNPAKSDVPTPSTPSATPATPSAQAPCTADASGTNGTQVTAQNQVVGNSSTPASGGGRSCSLTERGLPSSVHLGDFAVILAAMALLTGLRRRIHPEK